MKTDCKIKKENLIGSTNENNDKANNKFITNY